MITLLRATAPATAAEVGGGWVSAVSPTAAEVERLARDYSIPEERIQHALDVDERPRTQTLAGATLMVLRIPYRGGADAVLPYSTVPIGLILVADWIVTVCLRDHPIIDELRRFAEREWPAGKHHRFVAHALDRMAWSYLEQLEEIDRNVDVLEDKLSASLENREVIALLRYQKCLVHFLTALRSTLFMLERFRQAPAFPVPAEDEGLLDDVLVELRQANDLADISSNILGEMMDAFASIISNNLNSVMKFLAAITIVLVFPVAVASFYGMNVALPGQASPHAFALTLLVSLVLSVLVAILLRRRGWL